MNTRLCTSRVFAALLALSTACAHAPLRPVGDFHQHLFGPATQELTPRYPRVTARELVTLLDSAGIRYALLLSVAYLYSNPNHPSVANEYARQKAENDWTPEQPHHYHDSPPPTR